MVEWMLEDASRAYDFRYVALRYFNVAGADPKGRLGQSTPNATHLIKRAVQTALGGPSERWRSLARTIRPVTALACATTFRSPTSSMRIGRALSICAGEARASPAFAAMDMGRPWREVVDVVKRVSGVDFPVVVSHRRPGDPAVIVAKADRVKNVLGWKPTRDNLDEIVRQALDWERRLHNRRGEWVVISRGIGGGLELDFRVVSPETVLSRRRSRRRLFGLYKRRASGLIGVQL